MRDATDTITPAPGSKPGKSGPAIEGTWADGEVALRKLARLGCFSTGLRNRWTAGRRRARR